MVIFGPKSLRLFRDFSKMGGTDGQDHRPWPNWLPEETDQMLWKGLIWPFLREWAGRPILGRRLGCSGWSQLAAFQGRRLVEGLPKWLSDCYCRQIENWGDFRPKSGLTRPDLGRPWRREAAPRWIGWSRFWSDPGGSDHKVAVQKAQFEHSGRS